jgi:hypothetical protein
VYRETVIDANLKTGKRSKKKEVTGRNILKRQRSSVDCSDI